MELLNRFNFRTSAACDFLGSRHQFNSAGSNWIPLAVKMFILATPGPAPARPGPARPSSAGGQAPDSPRAGIQNAKNYFLLCCSPVKSQLIDILLPHIFSILTQDFDTWRFSPVQPGPAPARPCPAQVRLIPSPALRAHATPGPAPARPGPARPSSAGARRQIHLGLGSQNAKNYFLLCCSPVKSQLIDILLPHIFSIFDPES